MAHLREMTRRASGRCLDLTASCSSMRKKAAYHHGDLRRALLDAALRLIDTQGLQARSVREVARRAGVTHGAPYHHFSDRASLLAALAEDGFELLVAAMRSEQAKSRPAPDEQLAAVGRGYVAFALAHPAYFKVMFRPELSYGRPVYTGGTRAYEVLVASVTALQRANRARGIDRELIVLSSWSLVHGLTSLWLDGPLRTRYSPRKMQKLTRAITALVARLYSTR